MEFNPNRSIFWTLYAFFFAVPFPMILYYGINYIGGGTRHTMSLSTPYWALFYLLVSVILWLLLLMQYFRKWIVLPVTEQRQADQLLRTGIVRDAEIVACKEVGKPDEGSPQLDVTLRFSNLSGVPIHETIRINDTRPKSGRFNIGRHIRIRIDKTLTKNPVLAIDGSEFHADRTRHIAAFLGWLLMAGAVASYYVLSYRYEHQGTGWRFLISYHPLVICPLTLLSVQWLFGGGFNNLLSDDKDAVQLKYKGLRTQARLLSTKQTGTFINEQPQVRFELEYEDQHGATHLTSFKKIVDLSEMDVARTKTIPIFYLADQPQTVALAADLGDPL